MSLILYTPKKFGAAALEIIEQANAIIEEYESQGYNLTLRQLYYQFVARAIIPNQQKEYKRLGEIVNDARMAGMVSWTSIEDRTRGIESVNAWDSPEAVLEAAAAQFKYDLWNGQLWRPEVWVEKEALVGVVEQACEQERVAYLACRGYTSASESWRAAMRIVSRYHSENQKTYILHLGDHDPSGIDMTRDNEERLRTFCQHHVGSENIFEVRRIALNMEQVERYNPPPNPAKTTDSRFAGYAEKFGDESWELDALEPSVLDALIKEHVAYRRDPGIWEEMQLIEQDHKDNLLLIAENFDSCAAWLKDKE